MNSILSLIQKVDFCCRIIIRSKTVSIAVLNDPELSDIKKFLFIVLFAGNIDALHEIFDSV